MIERHPRRRLADLSEGRRRAVRLAVAYVLVLLALTLVGLVVSPVLLAGVFLVVSTAVVFVLDRAAGSRDEVWVPTRPSLVGLGRGSDHLTDALARRLSEPDLDPSRRHALAVDLHRQLSAVVVARVRRERGVDLAQHPEAADDVLPTDLARLVTSPPDPRLTDPATLAALLDRIESS